VIGDTAATKDAEGRPLPGVASVAKQQGQYLAALLKARAAGRDLSPFRYRDFVRTPQCTQEARGGFAVLEIARLRPMVADRTEIAIAKR